ncbi:WXG100 family type VII secretion target [Actinocatenispora rupis]|uniref:WXG100 family type VII secretion target n=1 Tax=Actinocatenispora rupis TaxID=519421 RepID=A0A8J3JBQ5_9ACTN|nr:WXG100 family type VII secretion target [Actinocatenispora rupis]GID15451.1 hypothetical protein Aru02nite_63400 [Actinocatenispora rupis]
MTADEYRVSLSDFSDAIDVVDAQSRAISGVLADLSGTFKQVEGEWLSPSGSTFAALAREYSADADRLDTLLKDILTRMRTTYRNYADAERHNVDNLTA